MVDIARRRDRSVHAPPQIEDRHLGVRELKGELAHQAFMHMTGQPTRPIASIVSSGYRVVATTVQASALSSAMRRAAGTRGHFTILGRR